MRNRWAFLMVLALTSVPAAAAQAERNTLGLHLGINFEGDDPLFLGPEGRFDVATISQRVIVQLNPSMSYYFVDNVTLLNFSFNVPFEFVLENTVVRPMVGPGLGLYFADWDGGSDTDLNLNILGGVLFHFEAVDPFVQLRLAIGDGSTVELMGGVLFVL
jgi:hypothetical protein